MSLSGLGFIWQNELTDVIHIGNGLQGRRRVVLVLCHTRGRANSPTTFKPDLKDPARGSAQQCIVEINEILKYTCTQLGNNLWMAQLLNICLDSELSSGSNAHARMHLIQFLYFGVHIEILCRYITELSDV